MPWSGPTRAICFWTKRFRHHTVHDALTHSNQYTRTTRRAAKSARTRRACVPSAATLSWTPSVSCHTHTRDYIQRPFSTSPPPWPTWTWLTDWLQAVFKVGRSCRYITIVVCSSLYVVCRYQLDQGIVQPPHCRHVHIDHRPQHVHVYRHRIIAHRRGPSRSPVRVHAGLARLPTFSRARVELTTE